MKVLIVYSHPSNTKSYTSEVLRQLEESLKGQNITYEISDLYEMDFQSDMTEEEYEREGLVKKDLPIPEDVKREQEKIETSDCIIFLYPVWWSDCPAKLKGWFDRVYSVGYAYGYNEADPIEKQNSMTQLKYGLVICTAGHPTEFLDEIGISHSMRNVMLDDRLGKRFARKEMLILGGTIDLEKVKQQHTEVMAKVGEKVLSNCA